MALLNFVHCHRANSYLKSPALMEASSRFAFGHAIYPVGQFAHSVRLWISYFGLFGSRVDRLSIRELRFAAYPWGSFDRDAFLPASWILLGCNPGESLPLRCLPGSPGICCAERSFPEYL